MMRKRFFFLVIIFGNFLGHSHLCFADYQEYQILPSKSFAEFRLGSTFGKIRGVSQSLTGSFYYDPDAYEVKLPVQAFLLVESFKTGIRVRDKAIYKMFESLQFPFYESKIQEVACRLSSQGGLVQCDIHAFLKIRTIEQPFQFAVNIIDQNDTLKIIGGFDMTTDQFELKPPTFFGIFRAEKDVRVHFETVWKKI